MIRRSGTDWRNPARWTRVHRQRKWPRASVSNLWDRNPFGYADCEVLVAVQPGVWRVDGLPVGGPNSFNGAFGRHIDEQGLYFPVTLWSSGRQSVTAIDLTDPQVCLAWAEAILAHFPWAQGIHADYFTSLAWLAPDMDFDVWTEWNAGWRLVCRLLRDARPGFVILGQQFHLTPITSAADGLFLEESPGHFGLSFADHERNMIAHGKPEQWVVELRNPELFPAEYVREVEAFTEKMGCYLSAGRDDRAW